MIHDFQTHEVKNRLFEMLATVGMIEAMQGLATVNKDFYANEESRHIADFHKQFNALAKNVHEHKPNTPNVTTLN